MQTLKAIDFSCQDLTNYIILLKKITPQSRAKKFLLVALKIIRVRLSPALSKASSLRSQVNNHCLEEKSYEY